MSPIQKNIIDRHHPNIQCMQARLPLSTYMGVAHMTLHVVRCPSLGWGRWILLLYTILRSNRHLDIRNAPTMSDRPTLFDKSCMMCLPACQKGTPHHKFFNNRWSTLRALVIILHTSATRYTDSKRKNTCSLPNCKKPLQRAFSWIYYYHNSKYNYV